jgi:uncharacterized caspase-like protein
MMPTMEDAIETWGQRRRQGAVGLFYFAGRGVQIGGDMYLLPLGRRFASEQDVRAQALPVGQVLGNRAAASPPLTIVILDAARQNPFLHREPSLRHRLTVTSASPGTYIAYATAPGGAVTEGQERNSIYTKYLLRALATPGLRLDALFRQVRQGVEEETGGRQTPWESSTVTEPFFLIPSQAETSPLSPASPPTPPRPPQRQ